MNAKTFLMRKDMFGFKIKQTWNIFLKFGNCAKQ